MGYSSDDLTESDLKTDLYRSVKSVAQVRPLLMRAIEEYNKTNAPVTVTLYKVKLILHYISPPNILTSIFTIFCIYTHFKLFSFG